MQRKTTVIYHADCIDGFGAAYAAWRFFGDTAHYYAGRHHVPPPDITTQTIYCLDFAYPEKETIQLAATNTVIVLDHHHTAQQALMPLMENSTITGTIDMNHSGAVLAWQHFFPNEPIPEVLLHIEDIDLWRFALPDTDAICAALSSYPFDFTQWHTLVFDTKRLREEGRHIRRFCQNSIDTLLKTQHTITVGDHTVPAINAPGIFASEIGNILAQDAPFAVVYYDDAQGRKFSLRSCKTGMDVAAIAAQFGGGGHRHAAGFRRTHTQLCID